MEIYKPQLTNGRDDFQGRSLMAAKNPTHVLQDEEQLEAISKRLKRAHGQLAAVIRMLEEGRNCDEIVTQMAAVTKAVNTAAFTLISTSLKECIEENRNNSEEVQEKLQKLFLSLA
jgi:DNA-binding FrmR family transcriptional regulator